MTDNTSENKNIDIWKLLKPYIIRWPWYVISIVFFVFLAWIYTRYLTPIYKSNISIYLKDTKSTNTTSSLLGEITNSANNGTNVDNEIEILRSIRLIDQVVKKLGLNHIYTKKGKIIEVETYKKTLPIYLTSINNENQVNSTSFVVDYKYPNVILKNGKDEIIKKVKVNQSFTYNGYTFMFKYNPDISRKEDEFTVKTIPVKSMAYQIQRNLKINLSNNYSTILEMSYDSPNPLRANDILTELISTYNQDAIADKKLEFEKTKNFINERISILNNELGGVESKIENFKKSNDVISVDQEAMESSGKKGLLESELLNIDTDISLLNEYKKKVSKENGILPQDITGTDNGIVQTYNQLVIERQDLKSKGAKNELSEIQDLNKNIYQAKQQILQGLGQKQKLLNTKRQNIIKELGKASIIKKKSPTLEKTLKEIQRQQIIKESLYLTLLQKREEAAISSAITQAKAKILNPAKYYGPIKPIKSNYYLVAIAIGLLLPISIVFVKELLKNKIESREDLEELIKGHPIVAEIPNFSDAEVMTLVQNDLSTISEAFRIMRTNVEFVLSSVRQQKKGATILVTSSIKGEGKTFISMNYAHILGQLKGKKTIIIGADIRNPQLHRFTNQSKNIQGLTDYLYTENTDFHDYINISKSDNTTDIIFSGHIPPNPTELLMSNKFKLLLDSLRDEYDYIIVDSAPLLLVSDTLNIGNYMDLTIFVTRAKYTPKEIISVPVKAIKEKRLNHIAFVLNDIPSSHSGYAYGYKYNYGYGYGYGQANKQKSFFNRLKDNLFNK